MSTIKRILFIIIFLLPFLIPEIIFKQCKKPPEVSEVRISYLECDLHQLPCWVAIEKGFFEEMGIKAVISAVYPNGVSEMRGFLKKKQDIGYVGIAPATAAVINETASVIAIAQVNSEGSAIVVDKNSSIESLGDLKGKKIAIPGKSTVQDLLLLKALHTANIEPNYVNLISVKPKIMLEKLRNNEIDGFIAWEPYPSESIYENSGRLLMFSSQIWPDHPCCILVVDTYFYKENPRTTISILKAHIKAINFIHENIEESIEIGAKYTHLSKEIIQSAIKNIKYDFKLDPDKEIEYVNFLLRTGYIREIKPEIFVKSFFRLDLLEKACG